MVTPLLRSSSTPEVSARLLPQLLWSHWDEYDEEERAAQNRLRRIDICGLGAMTSMYVAVVYAAAPQVDVQAPLGLVFRMQLFFIALALYNLHLQMFAKAEPGKDSTEIWCVCKGPLGRYVFLTHQIIGLVAVHCSISGIAPSVSQRLVIGTYLASIPVGGCASFVTIQFFVLVFRSPDATKNYLRWAGRGIHMKAIDVFVHSPPVFFAVADTCFLKERSVLLSVMPSVPMILLFYMMYAVAYICYLHMNHRLTSHWPYGVLGNLGSSVSKWVKFVLVQGFVLFTCAMLLWILVHLTCPLW